MKMNLSDPYQRRAYANRRLGLAIDRAMKAKKGADKEHATKWVAAWGWAKRLAPSEEAEEPPEHIIQRAILQGLEAASGQIGLRE